jgi:Domain of unknown function (DUF4331)
MTWKRQFIALAAAVVAASTAQASSHSDAPLIKQDPQVNLTDLYAFVGTRYNDPSVKVLNVVVHLRPFSEPGDGVMYDRFAENARHSIHITNPRTGTTAIRYDFIFSSVNPAFAPRLKNPNTILSYGRGTEIGPIQDVGDARQNFTQTYTVYKVVNGKSTRLGTGLLTPPPNVGQRTTPFYNDDQGRAVSGAATFDALDKYTRQTVYSLPNGEAVWAGPREDPFFADTPGIFDLLDPRILGDDLGQGGDGVDGFKGFNVLAYALQIPISDLQGVRNFPTVGVYASVSRRRITTLSSIHEPFGVGDFVQVNRLGNPLFNEVLVALRDKDQYNRTSPPDDQQFAKYALKPEVAVLANAVFGTTFQTDNRTDLAGIYIPDVLRVDTSTEPVRLSGQPGFNRLSVFGGDTTAAGKPSGWPNGRRLGDDVVDIALTAIASGPSFTTITPVGDNINANDQLYNQVFPYSGTPNAGPTNRKDP